MQPALFVNPQLDRFTSKTSEHTLGHTIRRLFCNQSAETLPAGPGAFAPCSLTAVSSAAALATLLLVNIARKFAFTVLFERFTLATVSRLSTPHVGLTQLI
jgi:hypothetical protein